MLRRVPLLPTCLLACGVMLAAAAGAATPDFLSAAVADSSRPDNDRQRDESRKPAETLAFAGVKPGESVGELLPSAGYFTRLFSKALGPKGHVYAWVPPRPANAPADLPDMAARLRPLLDDASYANVSMVQQGMTTPLPTPVDLVFTAQNYHDLHNIQGIDVAAFNKAVFDSLKPGGTYVVIDHSAQKGSGVRDTATLHRIDEDAVKSEVKAAGFEYVGSSSILASAADPRTAKVFDPAIRGHTDQFALKFRKPKH